MSRPDEITFAAQKQRAAVVDHADAISIEIGAGNVRAAANANVVGAVHSLAASAPVHEQVVVAIVLVDIGCLN